MLEFAAGATRLPTYHNPADIPADRLKLLLGDKRAPKRNFPALPYEQMAEFMACLASREGATARCLEFSILTASRPGMATGAHRSQFNIKTRQWTVRDDQMKMGWEHVVPLSEAAFDLVADLLAKSGEPADFMFPSDNGGELSDAAMAAAIKRMNRARLAAGLAAFVDPQQGGRYVVPHGYRSSFTDWAGDISGFEKDVREFALAHGINDETEAA